MTIKYEGSLRGDGLRVALVVSRFNETVTERLLHGALDALRRHGVDEASIAVAHVPGAFEIPIVAKRFAECGDYDAVVCLGAVIRGETPHFDHVAGQVSAGVARAGHDSGLPVIFGVLTVDSTEQAMDRAGLKSGNNGYNAAVSAIEMADLLRQLPKSD